MDNKLYQLLFSVELILVGLTVDKKFAIVSVLNSSLFHVSLYLC